MSGILRVAVVTLRVDWYILGLNQVGDVRIFY